MKALRAILAAAVLLVATCFSAVALEAPVLKGRVNDYAEVLSSQQRDTLERKLHGIEEKTTAQVVVLTVKTLDSEEIFDFTQKTFRAWKLGQAGKNNGVLMVIAKDERKIRIHTGLGLEGAIPDAEAWSIIRKIMAPKLQRGNEDYNAAITDGVERIRSLIYEEVKPLSKPISKDNKTDQGFLILFALVLIVAAFAGMLSMWAGGVVGGIGSALVAGAIFGLGAGMAGLVIGFLLGLIAPHILDLGLQILTSGGGGGGGGSVFSGGGGDSGGGGADGDF